MDADERELFAAGVRELAGRCSGAALDAALADLGWADALAADPRVAVSVLFEAQGAAASTSAALDLVLASALGVDAVGRVVLPPLGQVAPPGAAPSPALADASHPADDFHPDAFSRRGHDGSVMPASRERGVGVGVRGVPGAVVVRGLLAGAVPEGDGRVVLVWSEDGGGVAVGLVAVDVLEQRPVGGLDPAAGLVEVRGAVASGGWIPGSGVPVVGAPDAVAEVAGSVDRATWDAAVAAGQRALAHELVGTAQAMLDLAREHALERIQFGRPIAGFQAVRHKLAETLVAIESARGAVDAAWDEPTPLNAAVAKAIAGRSARLATRHCQQVLAGIGFTAEHRFHRHLRRARVLDGLLGDSRTLTRAIGEQLLEARGLPAILPLRQN